MFKQTRAAEISTTVTRITVGGQASIYLHECGLDKSVEKRFRRAETDTISKELDVSTRVNSPHVIKFSVINIRIHSLLIFFYFICPSIIHLIQIKIVQI